MVLLRFLTLSNIRERSTLIRTTFLTLVRECLYPLGQALVVHNGVLIHNKSTSFKSLTIDLQQANIPLSVIFMPLHGANDKYSTNIEFKHEYH